MTKALGGTAAPSTDPGGYISAYPQENRIGVLPITTDSRGTISPAVTVTDGLGGSTKVSVSVNAAGLQPGLGNVAVGVPVYLNSGVNNDTATTWSVVGPSTSPTYSVSTALSTGRNPFFTPDAQGKYIITTGTGSTLTLYAGKWVGVIDTQSTNLVTYTTKTVTTANGMWYGWAPSSTQSSFTYTNWPVINTDPGCSISGCHDGSTAPDVASEWKQTVHASFFSRGIENITSNGGTCLTCHTTGYDQAASAANNGFDDMATLESFTYPTKATGAWKTMITNDPQTAKRANIQCENCHGPQDSGSTDQAHALVGGTITSDLSPSSVRVNYGSEVCAQCHASGTGHHFFSEWLASINPDSNKGHSKLAQIDATGYSGHARSTDNSCVRCHTAQGFAVYVDQLSSGNAGTIPDSKITWGKSNAEVQTCTACHDPHSDENENQLRSSNTVTMTMAGFGVNGVGKGALCMICHNNRNGIQCASAPTTTGLCTGGGLSPTGATFLHEDAATNGATAAAPNPSNPDSYLDSMHDASQADVLMGRNFFFMGTSLPMISKHANVEDTCVGCHMALNPQTHLSHNAPAVSSHVFYIKDADVATLCANCHGNGTVDGEALQAFVEDQLDVLADKIAANLLARVQGQTIYINYYPTGQAAVHTALTVGGSTTVTYYDGNFCFNGTFSGSTCSSGNSYKASLANITTDSGGTSPVFGPNDRLKKASWNWTMIDRDGSKGIHNPTLITNVLSNTSAAMATLTP